MTPTIRPPQLVSLIALAALGCASTCTQVPWAPALVVIAMNATQAARRNPVIRCCAFSSRSHRCDPFMAEVIAKAGARSRNRCVSGARD